MKHSKNRVMLLSLVVFLAFGVHVGGIFLLQGMKVHLDLPRRALFENHLFQESSGEEEVSERRELKRKEEELATVFNRLVESPVSLAQVSTNVNIKELEKDLEKASLEDFLDEKEPLEPLSNLKQEISKEDLFSSLVVQDSSNEEIVQDTVNFPETSSMIISMPNEKELTDKLIQATNIIQGEVLVESLDSLDPSKGIKVGQSENASLVGTALENRNGFLNLGDDSNLSNAHPKLVQEPVLEREHLLQKMPESLEREGAKALSELSPQLLLIEDYSNYKIVPFLREAPDSALDSEMTMNPLASIASSEDFEVDVEYSEKIGGDGYVFKIIFKTKDGSIFKRIRKNLFFLVDRSHSIDRDRYELSKLAVGRALSLMNQGDRFNIIIFDDKVVRLSEKNLLWNKENVLLAKAFLAQQEHGGFFASTDIYASLGKIIPDTVADNEINAAILLSDGDTYLRRDQKRKMIAQWTKKNDGRVSLFSLASGRGNNLPLLELLSSFNKGILVYSSSYQNLEQTLLNLLQGIRTPIGKDIIATAIPSREDTHIMIYPREGHLPDLYQDRPYAIYGSINRLEDFHLFLQGKYYDKWLDIKQKVSMTNARRMDSRIERSWTVYCAYDYYYRFLRDGNFEHLSTAKRLLAPFNVQMAFQ